MTGNSWLALNGRFQNSIGQWISILFFAFLVVTVFAPVLFAQDDYIIFSQISIEEGLSQSIVACIAQDSRGFMWFGTEDGLNKFDGYRLTVIRHDPDNPNSLSYNEITSLLADNEGILWIGTFHGGLNEYNPVTKTFTHYRYRHDEPNSLSCDIVRVIYQDRSGVLWIGTDVGLNRFDKGTKIFTRYLHDSEDPNSLSHNSIRAICEDKSGMLWIGTNGGGLDKFDRQRNVFVHYKNNPSDSNSLSNDFVRSLYEDRLGTLWIGTVGGGLNKYNAVSNKFTHYLNGPNDPSSLSHDEVFSIYEDQASVLWIGTNGGGLNKFDKDKESFIRYENDPSDNNSIGYNEVRDIYEDRSGVIWIGTYGGGVNKFDRKRKAFLLYKHDLNDPNSLSQDIVWTIYEDDEGILWIGTHGGGLNRFDRQKNHFTHYQYDPDDPKSISNDIVRVVYEDRSGTLWIGTNGGGIAKFDRETETFEAYRHKPNDPNSISHNEIRSIFEDSAGFLWIGTNGGGLNKFDRATNVFIRYRVDINNPNSLSNDYVRVISEDRKGILWIGTQGGGLNKFDREKEIFTRYMSNPDDTNTLSNDYIFSFYEDKAGIFWMGTWGGGLNRFDPEKGTFKYYTTNDGLASDAIYGALEDDQGNLWLSTNNGLSRFNPETESFKTYSFEDGLQSNEFNGGSYFKSKSGEMFFGGIYGFNAFYPKNIKDNTHIPHIVITSFLKLNKEIELHKPIFELEELTLSYKDFIFSFEFAALDYTAPRKNLYAYKMQGLHDDWIYTDSNKRFATFTTLDPGEYTFRVKGSNNDGVWNEEGASIKVIITPPLWNTWWFKAVVFITVIGLIYVLYQWRLKNVRMEAELQTAHDAQMSIMPQSDPQVDGFDISGTCIPANEVGGDFYDIFWQDKERSQLGVTIGDVSGKAMKAAMIAVMSNGMIYSYAEKTDSPKDILTHLNDPLFMKTSDSMFTALCLASINIATKEITYTIAGMDEPLLKSGNSVDSLKVVSPGFPLGAFRESVYTEDTVKLKLGDVLVMFTDGITEAQNSSDDFYGKTRLIRLLGSVDTASRSAKGIKDLIIKDVNRFRGKILQQDDMTLVVIKCER